MRFDILTIFPEALEGYFNTSILKRAQQKSLIKIYSHNLRKWTNDRHQTVDDRPFSGGAGMIFKIEPIFKAVKELKKLNKSRVILFSPRGKLFNQKKAKSLSRYKQLILICPRYEGVDERVSRYIADETISVGNYILSGGEIPAMIVVDAVTRLLPDVIKKESLREESFTPDSNFLLEYPQYTRPAVFCPDIKNKKKAWRVPKVLLSGNHKEIEAWKKKHTSGDK